MMEDQGLERTVDLARYPLASRTFRERCRLELDHEGALVLPGFMRAPAVNDALSQSLAREGDAFFCTKSHNVFLLSPDPDLHSEHPRNREVSSSKGILADDQIDPRSPLRALYDSPTFRDFLRSVTGANGALHPYADSLASVNVHVQRAGQGFPGQLGCCSDDHLAGLSRLASRIREAGSLAVVQLFHAGLRAPAALIGQAPQSASEHAKSGARALHQRFLQTLARRMIDEEMFRVILGPAYPGHKNHLHIDQGPYDVIEVF